MEPVKSMTDISDGAAPNPSEASGGYSSGNNVAISDGAAPNPSEASGGYSSGNKL